MSLIKRFTRWIPRLLRRPWYAICITDSFDSTERWFFSKRAAARWVREQGRGADGSLNASYAFMWGFPKSNDNQAPH